MAHDILIVDDEADIRLMVTGILEDEGFATRSVANSDLALAEIDRVRPSVVILDIWLQNSTLDGMQLLKILQEAHPHLPVIMISGHGTIEVAVKAIHMGAYDFVEKPFKTDRMLLILHRAMEAARLKSENAELRLHPPGIGREVPDVAGHVVEPTGVGRIATDGHGVAHLVSAPVH